ncbi:MAG: GNA1162 family protein [Planctomycetota bacterium]|jgi:hypothetical protein
MKKFAILFLLLSSCASINKVSEVTINENFPHNEIQRIAVIMFEVPDKEKDGFGSKKVTIQDAGAILANVTAIELEKWGKYVVVSRKALKEELKLKDLREKDFLRTEDYSSLGKSLGVDAIIVGRVEDYGVSYTSISSGFVLSLVTNISFTANCLDVTTNETIWAMKIAGSSSKDNERVLATKLLVKAINTLKAKLK